MKILGIDYGESKIGLAISEGVVVEPLRVIDSSNCKLVISRICDEQAVAKIVVGLPEGRLVKQVKRFAACLEKLTNLPMEFQDETLTTRDAIAKMSEVGKRVEKEDAIAAAVILQEYLETRKISEHV